MLVSRFDILQQLLGVQFQIIIVSVLNLYLLLEVNCQFHYFLLTRTANLLYSETFLVVSGTHVVEFLLEFSILEFVFLLFCLGLFFETARLFVGKVDRKAFAMKFRTSLSRSLTLELECINDIILGLNHKLCVIVYEIKRLFNLNLWSHL